MRLLSLSLLKTTATHYQFARQNTQVLSSVYFPVGNTNYSHLLGRNFVRILDYELLGNIKQLMTLVDDDLEK